MGDKQALFRGICAVLGVLLMAGTGAAAPRLHLECRDPAAAPGLCAALERALAAEAPRYVLARGGPDGPAAWRDGDLALRLEMLSADARGLSGRLVWRAGPGAAPETGPETGLDVMDRALRPRDIDRFATALLRAAPHLRHILAIGDGR